MNMSVGELSVCTVECLASVKIILALTAVILLFAHG